MFNSTRLKYAIEALRDLNQDRSQLSRQLAALRARCQLREKVIDILYDYYDVVSGDYYAAIDGLVRFPESLEVLRDYMQEHHALLEDQLQKTREHLDQPTQLDQVPEKLEKITNYVFYMKDPGVVFKKKESPDL
jgi:hypothetical protein